MARKTDGAWPSVVSWILVSMAVIVVSFDTDLRWRYLLDMDVYIQGAEHFWTGTDLYDTFFTTRNEGLPFTYPPFGALVFTPLWLLTELIGQTATERVFTVMSVLMLWLIAKTLATAAAQIGHRVQVPVVLAILMCSLPVLSTLDLGQINTVLMALVIADAGRLFTRIPLGVLTGIAAAIKLTPLVFGLYFLVLWVVKKKPGGLIGMGSAFLGASALAWLVHPQNSMVYWTETLLASDRIGQPWYAKNVSLRGELSRFPALIEATAGTVLWGAGVVLIILLVAWATHRVLRRSDSPIHHLLAVTLVSLISLLCSPVSWHHHWVWLGPLAICLWFTGYRFLAGWAFFAQTAGAFHMFIRSGDRVEFDWTTLEHVLGTHYLWFAAIVLIWLVVRPAGKPPGGPAGKPLSPGGDSHPHGPAPAIR